MSDPWSTSPGTFPPSPPSVAPPWGATPGPPPVTEPPAYGAGPPLPPLPPPAGKANDRPLLIAIGVLTVLLLVAIGALVFVTRSSDDSTVGAAGTTTTTTSPRSSTSTTTRSGTGNGGAGGSGGSGGSTTTTPSSSSPNPTTVPSTQPSGPVASQAEIEAAVTDISAFVEKQRGLTFKSKVKVEVVGDADFNQRLLAGMDKDKASIEREGNVLKALNLMDPQLDLFEAEKAALKAGVLGYYDPETKELLVRGVQLDPFTRQTIAHELTHALDDQYFDLNRPQYDTEKDEISFGLSAVAEGNARRIENAYEAAMTPADRKLRDQEELEFLQKGNTNGIPPVLGTLINAPYELGPPFVAKMLDNGGNDQLGAAFTAPPRTSAQVIHPERYLAHDERVEVAKPKADGQETDDGVFGELLTIVTLEDVLDPAVAQKAANGWAGDWYVVWGQDGGGSCIRIDYKMKTPADLDDLKKAYTSWAATHTGAKVESVGSDIVEVTSCSGASGGGKSPA